MSPEENPPYTAQRRRRLPIGPPSGPPVDETSSPEDDARLLLCTHAESDGGYEDMANGPHSTREADKAGMSSHYARNSAGSEREREYSERGERSDEEMAVSDVGVAERGLTDLPVLAHQPQKEIDYDDLAKFFHLPITEGKSSC